MGIQNVSTTTSTTNCSVTDSDQRGKFPTITILAICIVLLEAGKLVFVLVKKGIKNRELAKVRPSPNNHAVRVQPKKTRQRNLIRAESFPKVSVPVLNQDQRRLSLPKPIILNVGTEDNIVPLAYVIPKSKGIPKAAKQHKSVAWELCFRTSSLGTLFAIICLTVLIHNIVWANHSFLAVSLNLMLERLLWYTLVIVLTTFDKDVLQYFNF